ncbi:MAG: XylR family transcriptional regulator [Planctomycetota bacterium]
MLLETSSAYGRGLLAGIVKYMRVHDQWAVFIEERGLLEEPPKWISRWDGDGIVSRVSDEAFATNVAGSGIPVVDLTDRADHSPFPRVRSDDRKIGSIGAEHYLSRGYRHFGFCGFANEDWSCRRYDGFRTTIDAALGGVISCGYYDSPYSRRTRLPWDTDQENIAKWVDGLPKPVAIMACNDRRGKDVIDACSAVGLSVPEQVSVLGVDNNGQMCNLCTPPLSSVSPNAESVGYRGAEMLADLMNGSPPPAETELIDPVGIETRQSSDAVAVADPSLVAALAFIRENACKGVSVDDVVRSVGLSRSTLERQCRRFLNRSPQAQIRHEQVGRIKELLRTTDLAVAEIAIRCGFEHPEYMHVVFKRVTGVTPGTFRERSQSNEHVFDDDLGD